MAASKVSTIVCSLALAAPADAANIISQFTASTASNVNLHPDALYSQAKVALLATKTDEEEGSGLSNFDCVLSLLGGAASSAFLLLIIWLVAKYATSSSSSKSEESKEDGEAVCRGGVCERPNKPVDAGVTSAAGCGAMCTVLMAIPSVVGSCCWPLLLVTAFGAGSSVASDTYREISHHFTLGADIVLFGAMIIYVARNSKPGKWGPVAVLAAGSLLMLMDPTRHVLLDHGGVIMQPQRMAMYTDTGGLSFAGRTCQLCTVSGLILLMIGVGWFMKLPEEFQKIFKGVEV